MKPCPHRVRELLTYCHRSNKFHWRKKPFGLRGLDNPTNVAGALDPISKEIMIRIDQYPFREQDLIKFFPAPKINKNLIKIKKVPGITWAKDKNTYRIRVFKGGKTISVGHCKNQEEAILMKLACEQSLGIKK